MFLVVYSVYTFDRLADRKEDVVNAPERHVFMVVHERFLLVIAIISYIVALVIGFIESPFAAMILLFPAILFGAYSKNISSVMGFPRLKKILVIKNLTIAVGWSVCVVGLPMIYLSDKFAVGALLFIFFFVKMFINNVPFDVRDVKGDTLHGVKTIPAVVGVKTTRSILLILNSLLMVFILIFSGSISQYLPMLVMSIMYGYVYIIYFCREPSRDRILFDVFIDGEWTFLFVLTCVYTYVFF
jgi:4-hydroxybenzoate polyprenyltransferase